MKEDSFPVICHSLHFKDEVIGRLPGAKLNVHDPVHSDLLDGLEPLVIDVLPQLHREPGGCWVFGPVELGCVEPCPGLNQHNYLLVRLLQLDQVCLVIYVVNLKWRW